MHTITWKFERKNSQEYHMVRNEGNKPPKKSEKVYSFVIMFITLYDIDRTLGARWLVKN